MKSYEILVDVFKDGKENASVLSFIIEAENAAEAKENLRRDIKSGKIPLLEEWSEFYIWDVLEDDELKGSILEFERSELGKSA